MLFLRRRPGTWPALVLSFCSAALVTGCASPGSPRPPSLHLPGPVSNLAALRSGDEVSVRFRLPRRTTDGQSLDGAVLHGALCRQIAARGPCVPVQASGTELPLTVSGSTSAQDEVVWQDKLPADLASGGPRVLAYRVTLRNAEGRSSEPSDPVYAAAGAAPAPVEHFAAEGSRLGVLLHWTPTPGPGEVLLERTQLDPVPPARAAEPTPSVSSGRRSRPVATKSSVEGSEGAAAGVVWMQAAAGEQGTAEIMDSSVAEGVRYRYRAVRQITATVGGRSLQLRSTPSDAAEITWRDVFPPPAPQQLTALGYATGDNHGGYAVDLIWQPVNDARVTGYVVTRQELNATGEPEGTPQDLSPSPVKTPSFHDLTAEQAKGYVYTVKATDAKGNMSAPATAKVAAQNR